MKLPVMLQANNQIVDADKRLVCEVGNNPNAKEDGEWLVKLINGGAKVVEVKENDDVEKKEQKEGEKAERKRKVKK